jgi:hypothetical protein
MIETLDIIDRLPFELQARLEGDDFFSDIPVVVAEEGNIKLELGRKQAVITAKSGHRGVAVVVLQVVADDDFPNLQFGPMTVFPAFQVIENVELNRGANGTQKSARKVARRIRDVIKCAGMIGLVKNMQADKPAIEPVDLGAELGDQVKGYQVNFKCLEASAQDLAQVAIPQFAPVQGQAQFTITCETAGASIYYTVDDSYPTRAAALYAGPVGIPEAGLTVRACGYKAGMVASWVNRGTISLE